MSDLVWISNRNMILGEYHAQRGKPIPDKVLASINQLRFNSLVRVGHLRQVEKSILGDDCPVCGEGPFTRMARHMTAMHPDDPAEVLGLTETGTVADSEEVILDLLLDVEAIEEE